MYSLVILSINNIKIFSSIDFFFFLLWFWKCCRIKRRKFLWIQRMLHCMKLCGSQSSRTETWLFDFMFINDEPLNQTRPHINSNYLKDFQLEIIYSNRIMKTLSMLRRKRCKLLTQLYLKIFFGKCFRNCSF